VHIVINKKNIINLKHRIFSYFSKYLWIITQQ